jgi:hypothetical protein
LEFHIPTCHILAYHGNAPLNQAKGFITADEFDLAFVKVFVVADDFDSNHAHVFMMDKTLKKSTTYIAKTPLATLVLPV